MGGICGFFQGQGAPAVQPSAALAAMMDALGPPVSTEGSEPSGPGTLVLEQGRVGLGCSPGPGMAAGTAQLQTPSGSFGLAYHGVVYAVASQSIPLGGAASVAEILLSTYRREREGLFAAIDGDFSLAVWDGERNLLLIATDRFRIEPLFYARTGPGNLVFASRVPAILASGLTPAPTIRPESLTDVIASSYIPTPHTIYRDVFKVEPGAFVSTNGGSRASTYWSMDYRHGSRDPEPRLAEEVRQTLHDAVQTRVLADAGRPIGTYLSGGIDSSTVTGLVSRIQGGSVQAFSIGFEEGRFNEMDYARIAADAFGAEHHRYVVTPRDVLEAIPVLIDQFDEPYGNASAIPTLFCARMARDHGIRVAYAGDGGDELFGGNERYATQRVLDLYHRLPRWPREAVFAPLVGAMARALPGSLFQKGQRYIERARVPYPERLTVHSFFRLLSIDRFFAPDFLRTLSAEYTPYEAIARAYRDAPATDSLHCQLYTDLRLAICDNDLFKVVRMTQAAGLGVRFPFLDRRLAELSARIPAGMLMRGTELRSFFKRAYRGFLPPQTLAKTKHGFGLPIAGWLREDPALREMMHDLVLAPRSLARGYFQERSLRDLVQRHASDTTSYYGAMIWNLMVLELWHRRYAP